MLGRAAQAKSAQAYPGTTANGDELARWAEQNHCGFLHVLPLATDSKSSGVLVLAAPEAPDDVVLAFFRVQARIASAALHDAELVAAMQHSMDRLQSMVEASKIFNSTLDLVELLGKILDVAKDVTKAERGTLFLVDEKTDEIWSMIAQGMEKEEIRLPRGRGIAGHVALTGDIVNIPDAMPTIDLIPKSISARGSTRQNFDDSDSQQGGENDRHPAIAEQVHGQLHRRG